MVERRGLTLLHVRPESTELNLAIVTRHPTAPETVFAEAREFFRARGSDWHLEVPKVWAAPFARLATRHGLIERAAAPGMVLLVSALRSPPSPPGFRVEVVRGRVAFHRFATTAAAGFERPEFAGIERVPDFLGAPDLTMYVGYRSGVPVTTACRIDRLRVAHLLMVTTRPAARGHGYASATTYRAAADGFEAGCRASWLRATDAGIHLYERLGYRTLESYRRWDASRSGRPPLG